MSRRLIPSSLAILTAAATWMLLRQYASTPEPHAVSSAVTAEERSDTIPELDPSAAAAPQRPEDDPVSTASDPLTRQRDRLDDTAIRLRARRGQAQASGAPETTLQALDAHLARIEQRLATLAASG